MEKPEEFHFESTTVEVKLTDKEKTEFADELVRLQDTIDVIEENVKEANGHKKEIKAEQTYVLSQLKKGVRTENRELIVRKNFQPGNGKAPVKEFLDLDMNIVKTEILKPNEYQVEMGEWVLGEAVPFVEIPNENE